MNACFHLAGMKCHVLMNWAPIPASVFRDGPAKIVLKVDQSYDFTRNSVNCRDQCGIWSQHKIYETKRKDNK